MTVDQYIAPPDYVHNEKVLLHIDADHVYPNKSLLKSHRWLQSTSFVYPILLVCLLILGAIFLVVIVTRRTPCNQHHKERAIEPAWRSISSDHTKTWTNCVKLTPSSSCVCPASYIHSGDHPLHCIPSHSRCLQSCQHNAHCSCHRLANAARCRQVTRDWIENEFHIGLVKPVREVMIDKYDRPSDHFDSQLEHLLINNARTTGERLFLSADRRTGLTVGKRDEDYLLLNHHWTKLETNTSNQHLIYTQVDAEIHSCRLSSLLDNGAVKHGPVHTCPGLTADAPYFFAAACQDVLILWRGTAGLNVRRQDDWSFARHNFESVIPTLSVLLDPFHRYYSLYDDSMIEIKDLNGDALGQVFTDINRATRFEFIDHQGTLLVANQTHTQLFTSTNAQIWLDV